ncbi:maleylpyruvate isomerase N-terminal domain-containing protein [Actinokineospora sp. NPDC004072]
MANDARALYVSTADTAVQLLSDPAVARAWDAPSALPEFSVRGLAGHLAAQIFAIPAVLSATDEPGEPIPVVDYYRRAKWREPEVDLQDPSKLKARESGESHAADGHPALVERSAAAARAAAEALAAEPADRVVALPWAGASLTLDDFATTRLLELAIHCDDLAVSVGIDTPPLDPAAALAVIDILTRLSLDRHGPTPLLRALSRAERAPADITAM